jgi:anti-anti-sigma regulatory factor
MNRLAEWVSRLSLEFKAALLVGTLLLGTAVVMLVSRQSAIAGGMAVLLGVGMTVLVVNRVMRRLGRTRQALLEMTNGAQGATAEPRTRDQVDELAAICTALRQSVQLREQAWVERTDMLKQSIRDLEGAVLEWQSKSKAEFDLLDASREPVSPAVPIFQGMIVLPLSGQIGHKRAGLITASLLSGVEEYDARVAIIDITGVPEIDEQSALSLLCAAEAAELMGCRAVLTGLRPEFAQALVRLGVDAGNLVTRSDLEGGMRYGLASLGFGVSKRNEGPKV